MSVFLACDGEDVDGLGGSPSDPGGKADTGYLSNIAVEIEGEYRGLVRLTFPGYSPAELQDHADGLKAGTVSPGETLINQIKFGKNQFNSAELHVNLIDDDTKILEAYVDGNEVVVEYQMIADAVVSHAELEASGIELEDLIGDRFEARVPADPRQLAERIGPKCASGISAAALEDWNYFYYFDPDKAGCDIELEEVSLELRKVNDEVEGLVYPEYDRLTEDGKIEAVVFFGAATHDEITSKDWGVREWTDFERRLGYAGFASEAHGEGKRWTRKREGLEEIVDVYSPYTLEHGADALFVTELGAKEIIIYTGHSFYGSLNVLDDRDNYTEGKYQILFMSSCWTYEYYTKQVFKNKASEADPTGWRDADVVNDTEVGWFHNYEDLSSILLINLLKGAESGGKSGKTTFDWGSIIQQMNAHAVDAWKRRKTKTHEIFGVSGVRTNEYQPD